LNGKIESGYRSFSDHGQNKSVFKPNKRGSGDKFSSVFNRFYFVECVLLLIRTNQYLCYAYKNRV